MPPLSTAVSAGDYVILSGIPPVKNGQVIAPQDIALQAEYVLTKMDEVLAAFELSLKHLAYVQIYLQSMDDYETVNAVYERHMPQPYPARKVIITDFAVKGVRLEMNGIATGKTKECIFMP